MTFRGKEHLSMRMLMVSWGGYQIHAHTNLLKVVFGRSFCKFCVVTRIWSTELPMIVLTMCSRVVLHVYFSKI